MVPAPPHPKLRDASDCWALPVPCPPDDGANIVSLRSYLALETFCLIPATSIVSVLTGIIKISLKTLLECVRLRTFGRFGLQQVQVDCHFLQLYLWRFVADEELVHLLLDEVVASAALRCPDPVPMEPSVVEVICERG